MEGVFIVQVGLEHNLSYTPQSRVLRQVQLQFPSFRIPKLR